MKRISIVLPLEMHQVRPPSSVMMNNKRQGGKYMSQTITVKVKLLPTKEQIQLLQQSSHEYIRVVNTLVAEMAEEKKRLKRTTKDISANLPSAVKNQAIKNANSAFSTKVKKSKYAVIPLLKKPICVWNNQNYSFDFTHISIPFMIEGKSKRLKIRALFIDKDHQNIDLLKHKLGTLRVTKSSGKLSRRKLRR